MNHCDSVNSHAESFEIVELDAAELSIVSGGGDVEASGGYSEKEGWHGEVKVKIHF